MDDHDKPFLRRAVRAHLAERPAVSQSAETIHRRVGREYEGCTVRDVEAACQLLVDLEHLKTVADTLGGSTSYYQIHAKGVIAHERGE